MPSVPAASLHVPVPRRRNPVGHRAHLATARAFAHAVEQGQALAASDRAAVEKVLPAYMPISKNIAALVNLNAFPTSADLVQLQRVADLMQMGGMLARPLNVAPLVSR